MLLKHLSEKKNSVWIGMKGEKDCERYCIRCRNYGKTSPLGTSRCVVWYKTPRWLFNCGCL